MTETIMGSSGFKYTESFIEDKSKNGRIGDKRTCIIKYLETDEILFTIIGKEGKWQGRGRGATKTSNIIGTKKFLGLDNRYYYIEVTYDKVIWGQIQSSGAVIAEDRSIIKQLDFFPMNIETPTVPIIKIVPVTPINAEILIIPDTPPIKSLTPVISNVKEVKWIEQIMNQINQIINQINQAIQSILNQLKQNK